MEYPEELSRARFQYVLDRIASANENSFKVFGIFQGVMTSLLTALVALCLTYRSLLIPPDRAIQFAYAVLIVLSLSAALSLLVLIANTVSWWRYREEETTMLVEAGATRAAPSIRSLLRWNEFYLGVGIVAATCGSWIIGTSQLIPTIS